MPYASVVDPSNPTTSPLTGIFNMPQNVPEPGGYIGEIASTDTRITAFLTSMNPPSPNPIPGG